MPMPKIIDLPLQGRDASVLPESIDTEARTIDIVWTTGAVVRRARWEGWDVVEYDEELVVSPDAVRLERLNTGAPFLDSHRSWGLETVLGSVVPGSVRIADGKGTATIRLTGAPDAEPIIQRILERTINKVSVGYRVHQYDIRAAEKKGERDLYRAVDWEPYEISAVAMPADPGATIRSAQPGAAPTLHPCAIRRALTTKGNVMENDTQAPGGDAGRTQGTVETRTTETTPPATAPAQETPEAIRAAEQQRATQIMALCERHNLGMERARQMIARNLTMDHARAEVLDILAAADAGATRTHESPPAQVRGDSSVTVAFRAALEETILHRISPAQHQLTPAAREFQGRRLLEIARIAIERQGIDTRGMAPMELAAIALGIRAGYHGTGDFPMVLGSTMNRVLRAAYDSTPRTFVRWASRKTISDFRQVERLQIGGAPDLTRVLENGEFQYGTIGEGKEVYALATYGRIIAFTRQMLINDDLGAFDNMGVRFGASAADLESDIVYSILISNPTMGDGTTLFHASHGNVGTAAAVTEASLTEAFRMFAQQKGLEGRLISVLPSFAIVPPGKRAVEMRKQLASTTPANTTDVNPYSGRLEVVEEPRLIPAAGTDPWFLAASPARMDTVEYAYLEGQEGVFTETRSGFEVDGVEFKARHDFAAKAIDWRGLFRNAGAA